MKKTLISLIALLLVAATMFLCACGGGSTGTGDEETPGGGGENPGGGNDAVYDPSLPMGDPTSGALAYLYGRNDLLQQPTSHIFPDTSIARADVFSSFEKAEDIINRSRPETPLYGLYTFAHEYLDNQDSMTRVGFTNARITMHTVTRDGHTYNGLTDDYMHTICESGISVMWTSGCNAMSFLYTVRDDALMRDLANYGLSSWLWENANMALALLERYGPRGTYFQDYPNANYNPIRYIEVFNEPNFQYLISVKTANGADDAYAVVKYHAYALLQTVVSAAVRATYNDEVKIVGISAGGGAEDSGTSFVSSILSYKNSTELTFNGEKTTLGAVLSDALDSSKLVQHANESDAKFEARKGYADDLRRMMGLSDGETPEIDMVNSMDIMSIHPYADGSSPFAAFRANNQGQAQRIKKMRTALINNVDQDDPVAVQYAKDMPIWFTECGWQLKGPAAYAEAYPEDIANGIEGGKAAEYSSSSTGTSQILQAAMEVQDYMYGIRNGIDRITYMHMYDTDGCNYGLVNYGYKWGGDYSWRLTLYAINTMATLLPNPALVGVVKEGAGTKYYSIYEIESDVGGEIVTAVFTPLEPETVQVPWEDDYALVTDMFGKSKIVKSTGGYVTVEAGPYMVYLRHVSNDLLIEHGIVTAYVSSDAFGVFGHAWIAKEELI